MNSSYLPVLLALALFASPALAEDKGGIRLNVVKKTLDRADGKPSYMREVDRSMALKATIKNLTSKEMPEATLDCVILIQRWGLSETGATERYKKTHKLPVLKSAQEVELLVGDYHIGGHMHGRSDEHVDQILGWKITVDHAGKKTEFVSKANFDALDKRAKDARQ